MKTLVKRPTNKDGMGEKQNLKLTQIRSTRKVVAESEQCATDFYDEYFFGYTDTHAEHAESETITIKPIDLEVSYGLL